jgi:hypothetical protein
MCNSSIYDEVKNRFSAIKSSNPDMFEEFTKQFLDLDNVVSEGNKRNLGYTLSSNENEVLNEDN